MECFLAGDRAALQGWHHRRFNLLVFIPCLGEFVIPSLLGGAENIMIGRVVWDEMFSSNNWPRAAALAVVMVLFILVPTMAVYTHYSGERDEAEEA